MCPDSNYIVLDSINGVWRTQLPNNLYSSESNFERLWQLRPDNFPTIFLHGREITLPRWQQAYGRNYHFSGKSNKAKTVPPLLKTYLIWAQKYIDKRLNGLLLNWYDACLGHYIGAHRDNVVGIVKDSVIVMISLGETRITRFRSIKDKSYRDIEVHNGDTLVMSLETNQVYKHEVPKFKRYQGKRISITLRCFESLP